MLARVFLKQASLLVLDEATSALDTTNEQTVLAQLQSLHATLLVISHRPTTIRSCSRVMVLKDGTVVGIGAHKELAQSCQTYAELCGGTA